MAPVSAALMDGEITPDSFSDAKLADPGMAALMQKVKVEESREFSAQYPESAPCRIVATLRGGGSIESFIRYPKGHDRSPLDDAELDRKFQSLFRGFGSTQHCADVLALLRRFDTLADVRELGRALVRRT